MSKLTSILFLFLASISVCKISSMDSTQTEHFEDNKSQGYGAFWVLKAHKLMEDSFNLVQMSSEDLTGSDFFREMNQHTIVAFKFAYLCGYSTPEDINACGFLANMYGDENINDDNIRALIELFGKHPNTYEDINLAKILRNWGHETVQGCLELAQFYKGQGDSNSALNSLKQASAVSG